ncbi:hypothetical protein MCC01998_07090 [Bifidobacteriaceae bacterium MCC01998]|nr:hypothetical protein BBPC_0131 [Bifidobacterium pseudocatenulatum DSM 20438 = JCM 1200 = LMG 10505]GDZ44489.1 hypothetical protein MCC02032_08810 [Bifidobacteriaceae bacterium MCC02032]GDZ50148.1 hypothetical protein MCC02034_06840 [Bifidobacteriaceae bacterium MCC02034]GDZ51395.1 hypothetical protein MCC02035_00880 [Bifidobacteriaceae bacterium MCC02035]GDZ55423.1 hypothetical protein MCC01996_01230 [Bifidobacteriaceae bacterium MCC01996]GDZ62266.1 hypothetical protein MCC02037_09290 [Bifi
MLDALKVPLRGLRGKPLTSPEESPLGFPLHGSVAKPTIKHTYSAADLWGPTPTFV